MHKVKAHKVILETIHLGYKYGEFDRQCESSYKYGGLDSQCESSFDNDIMVSNSVRLYQSWLKTELGQWAIAHGDVNSDIVAIDTPSVIEMQLVIFAEFNDVNYVQYKLRWE